MYSKRFGRAMQGALAFAALGLAACGMSLPGSIDKTGGEASASGEKPLSSYLHDISPKNEEVTFENAILEHYRIPTSSGAVLDGWFRRPPGDEKVPVVINFTPYYGGGDPNSPLNSGGETTVTFSRALLPYGYAIGHISVGGTGNSGGCFRDGGAIERKQLYDAVEYMAAQPWSNGKVAAIGVSYDGTTANELFVDPPPSLKTVVPMESITDYYRYSFNNGMRRGTNSLFTAYYYISVGLEPQGSNGGFGPADPMSFITQLLGEACPEQVLIQTQGLYSTVTGDKLPVYWDDRDMIRLVSQSLDRPRPPMFYIQGYQDANVDPQHSQGFLEAVKATGVPLKIWYGQWVHAYPEPSSVLTADPAYCQPLAPCRGDFFNIALIAWFDQWLKGRDTGILDTPMVQTQADDGVWRHEDQWPPAGVSEIQLHPAADGSLAKAQGTGTAEYTDDLLMLQPGSAVEYLSEPLPATTRLTGMPRLETVATSSLPRAGLVATLLEQFPDGTRRYVNFAAQSLNHAENLGRGDLNITGKAIPVDVQLFTQDNIIAAGSRLVLVLGSQVASAGVAIGEDPANFLTTGPNLMPIGLGATVNLDLARTTLHLPVNAGNRIEPLTWPPAAE